MNLWSGVKIILMFIRAISAERRWIKKYAFVSDYIRVEVLVYYGGIYLDTDIIVKKKFDDILFYDLFLGKMYESALGTAVIGAVKSNVDLIQILKNYKNNVYELMCPNNINFTNYFIEKYHLNMSRKSILFDNTMIFDRFTFENPSFFQNNGYTIHLFSDSWYDKPVRNYFFKAAQFFVRRSMFLFYLERLIRTYK